MDWTETGNTTLGQSGPESNDYEGVLQIWKTGATSWAASKCHTQGTQFTR